MIEVIVKSFKGNPAMLNRLNAEKVLNLGSCKKLYCILYNKKEFKVPKKKFTTSEKYPELISPKQKFTASQIL